MLLVDDAAVLRPRLSELLEEVSGVRLLGPARNASDAFRLVDAHLPACVVVGLEAPNGDVLRLLQKVRGASPACAIVVLTNRAEPALADALLQAGANWLLGKTDLDQLVGLLDSVVRERAC